MTSRKRLAAAVGELLQRFSPTWIAEAFLAEYRELGDWNFREDRKRIDELEAMVVVWLRRSRAEENKERRQFGLPLLPKKKPWTGKRSRKKATRKAGERKGGA
jgi:hypothetical protein